MKTLGYIWFKSRGWTHLLSIGIFFILFTIPPEGDFAFLAIPLWVFYLMLSAPVKMKGGDLGNLLPITNATHFRFDIMLWMAGGFVYLIMALIIGFMRGNSIATILNLIQMVVMFISALMFISTTDDGSYHIPFKQGVSILLVLAVAIIGIVFSQAIYWPLQRFAVTITITLVCLLSGLYLNSRFYRKQGYGVIIKSKKQMLKEATNR